MATKKEQEAEARGISRDGIYAHIELERQRQDEEWGGPRHDDQHTASQWASFRGKFENRQQRLTDDPAMQRKALVQMAALCVAQIESLDRRANQEEEES
jgi:hypothetical protein